MALLQVFGDGGGEIGQDHVGADALDRREHFERGAFLIDPAVHSGRTNHRVLADPPAPVIRRTPPQ